MPHLFLLVSSLDNCTSKPDLLQAQLLTMRAHCRGLLIHGPSIVLQDLDMLLSRSQISLSGSQAAGQLVKQSTMCAIICYRIGRRRCCCSGAALQQAAKAYSQFVYASLAKLHKQAHMTAP